MNDRRNMTPADELGMLREEMKRLKAREAELREEILATGDASGTQYTVEIKTQERRTFDRKALPQEIQDDPEFWKVSTRQIVKTIPIETAERRRETSLIDEDDFR